MLNYLASLPSLGVFVGTVIGTILLEWLFRRFYVRMIRRSTVALNNDPINYRFLGHLVSAIIYTVGFILAIREVPSLRTLAGSLLAGAGIFAVIIGFASQQALNNVLSGLFLVLFKPFRVNDRLKIRKEYIGVVEDITLRHTILRDPENRRIIIPNSVINAEIIVNADYLDNRICKFIEFNVAYDTDIELAKTIMGEEVAKHPTYIDPRTVDQKHAGVPNVIVRMVAILPYAITLRANAWAMDNLDAFVMYCDLLEAIKKRFDAEGIKIPMLSYLLQPLPKEDF